jgi:hypothetical protein
MEDDLSPEVRRHQAECASCREAMAEHGALLELLDEWTPRQEVPPGFETRLYQRIRAQEAQPARIRFRWSLPEWMQHSGQWSLAGAVLSLILICMGVLYQTNRPQPQPTLPIAQVAKSDPVVRDLQVLDQDSDLLENFDFLSASAADDVQAGQTDTP